MYDKRKKYTKKAFTIAMGTVLFLGSALAGRQTVMAETVQGYNTAKAVAYATEHFDDSKTSITDKPDCIQFVRECMEAGGVPKDAARDYGYTVETYKDYLLNNGYAQMYKLDTEKQDWSKPQWYVRDSDNEGRLSVGDGILYYCNNCDKYFHASICNDVDEDGFAHYYAQNVAVDDKPLCQIDHAACGTSRENVSLYALHITSSANGYRSDYDNKTISNLKVLRTGVTKLNITWDAVSSAKGYKVFVKNGKNSVLNQIADVSGTSITFDEPTKDAAYYFAVRPYFEKDGKQYVGKLSEVVKNDEEQATTKLKAPEGVTLSVVDGKIKLAWNKVAGADRYEVWRATSENGTYFQIYTGDWNGCTNSSVKTGNTYYYKIKAIDNENEAFNSDFSKVVFKTLGRLAKPTVKISNVSTTGKINVKWKDISGAGKYEVYRSTKSSRGFSRIGTTKEVSYIDSKAKAGTKYYYKVKALHISDAKANSNYSSVASGTCDLPIPKIKTTQVTSSTGYAKVSWGKVSGASKYSVYRATSQNGKYSRIASTSRTYYYDSKATVGKIYYYKVVALHKKSAANSTYSEPVSGMRILKKPVVKASSSSKKKIKLSWKKVSGAQQYVIYSATSKNGSYKLIATVKGTNYTHNSLTKGKTYYYKVKALHKNSTADSAYSSVVSKKCK